MPSRQPDQLLPDFPVFIKAPLLLSNPQSLPSSQSSSRLISIIIQKNHPLDLHHVSHPHRSQRIWVRPSPNSIFPSPLPLLSPPSSTFLLPQLTSSTPPSYVLATATLSTLVASWHNLNTGQFRKAAKVPYPNAYCTHAEAKESKEKYLFNCAQRAHANFVEHQPQFLVGLLVGGLRCMYIVPGRLGQG